MYDIPNSQITPPIIAIGKNGGCFLINCTIIPTTITALHTIHWKNIPRNKSEVFYYQFFKNIHMYLDTFIICLIINEKIKWKCSFSNCKLIHFTFPDLQLLIFNLQTVIWIRASSSIRLVQYKYIETYHHQFHIF